MSTGHCCGRPSCMPPVAAPAPAECVPAVSSADTSRLPFNLCPPVAKQLVMPPVLQHSWWDPPGGSPRPPPACLQHRRGAPKTATPRTCAGRRGAARTAHAWQPGRRRRRMANGRRVRPCSSCHAYAAARTCSLACSHVSTLRQPHRTPSPANFPRTQTRCEWSCQI